MPSIVLRIGFAIAVVAALSGAASADTLRIGGSGAATGFLPDLFAPIERHDATKLKLVPNLGSSGGLQAEDGVLDVVVSGRALTCEELKRGLTQAVSIRTLYGLATSLARPNGFKSKDIAEHATGNLPGRIGSHP